MIHPTIRQLAELRYDARSFSLLPRQPVNSLLSGRHASRLRGRGLTFEELRDYRPGDDIRAMDWKATARLRKPHVRVYTEERQRPVLLVVDQRTNMFFGSARTTKATAAAELAALAAWRSVDSGDSVGAVIFGDDEIIEIKPHRSKTTVMRICGELVRFNQNLKADGVGNTSMLNEALMRAANIAKHDYLVVLITDYNGDDRTTQKHATRIASHNDVLAALVYDPLGFELPTRGQIPATDGITQRLFHADEKLNDRFRKVFQNRCDQLRERLRSIRVPILPICTHEPVVDQVLDAFGKRR